MKPWLLTYKPTSIDHLKGFPTQHILTHIAHFKQKKKRGLLIYGPPGCGKTTAVHIIAQHMQAELVEMNASDTRNKQSIQDTLGNAIQQQSFFFSTKIIFIDEIDGLSGTEDRGAATQIANLIKSSAFPIILACQDPFLPKIKAIVKECETLEIPPASPSTIASILTPIAQQEKVAPAIVNTIAHQCGGDIRSAIQDLQLVGTSNDAELLPYRAKATSIEQALAVIFKTTEAKTALEALDAVEEDTNQQMLWIDYNMPQEYTNVVDRARAYGCITKADVYMRRIMKRQHWRFLVYVHTLLSAGIATAKTSAYKSPPIYKQSTRILRLWQLNMTMAKKKAIAQKIAQHTHTSTKRILQDFYWYASLLKVNPPLQQELDLQSEEIAWIQKSY